MADLTVDHRLRRAITLCWVSLVALPLGLLPIGVGPCSGPNSTAGSILLLLIGLAGVGLAAYGVARILRLFRSAAQTSKFSSALAMICGGVAFTISGFYCLIGASSIQSFMH